jgi:hypothetical protein
MTPWDDAPDAVTEDDLLDAPRNNRERVTGFTQQLTELINRFGMDDYVGLPDFMLADYLMASIHTFEITLAGRQRWKHGAMYENAPTLERPVTGW